MVVQRMIEKQKELLQWIFLDILNYFAVDVRNSLMRGVKKVKSLIKNNFHIEIKRHSTSNKNVPMAGII